VAAARHARAGQDAGVARVDPSGLLPAAQTALHAPWRIRLTDDVRAKFKPDVPDGYLSLEMAARRLGLARQTVLNQVRAGQRDAIQVVNGKRRGLRIHVADTDALCWGSDHKSAWDKAKR
jgi:hypothetical protein